jgi:hypothetical protein
MRGSRRGQTAVVVALSATVLFSFGALAVDMGFARAVRVELQNGADAAAHAAVQQLDGTDVGLATARGMAVAVAAQNVAAGTPIALDANAANAEDGDLVLGIWDYDAGTFTPSTDATLVNAAKANAGLAALPTFFARIMGTNSVAVGARSVMVQETGGASEVDCFLPLAIPDCLIGYHGGLS